MVRPYITLVVLALIGATATLLELSPKTVPNSSLEQKVQKDTLQPVDTLEPIDALVAALIYVESRGNENAVGDKHLASPSVGVLQIRPIMVREVNRICKRIGSHQRFTLRDRFDREKSIHMFLIWKEFHHKDSNFEAIARSWNGGPRWRKIKRTEKYWRKVQREVNKLRVGLINEGESARSI